LDPKWRGSDCDPVASASRKIEEVKRNGRRCLNIGGSHLEGVGGRWDDEKITERE